MREFDKKTKKLYLRPNDKSGGIKLKNEDHYHDYDKDRKFIKDAKKRKGIKKALDKNK